MKKNNKDMKKSQEDKAMAKDFDLDVQVLKTETTNEDGARIKSWFLCTPGCNPTATLCTSCIFACV